MIKPLGHRVVVKRLDVTERDEVFKAAKAAGIELAKDHADMRAREAGVDRGTVVSIGADAWKGYHWNNNPHGDVPFEPWCKVGDLIAFAKYSGMPIKDGEAEFVVINDEDVVAVLEEA